MVAQQPDSYQRCKYLLPIQHLRFLLFFAVAIVEGIYFLGMQSVLDQRLSQQLLRIE